MLARTAVLVALAASTASATIVINASSRPFTDISATGTSVGAIADDSELVITGASLTAAGFVGNELLPGGVSVRVGNNGGIIWGNSPTDTFTNATEIGYANCNATNPGAPSIAGLTASNGVDKGNGGLGPRHFLAVLWDDNFPIAASNTSTKWQVVNGNLIIQWTNESHWNQRTITTNLITYQAVIYGNNATIASGAPLIDYVYQDTLYTANAYQNDGGSAAIGFKNWANNANANDVEFGIAGGALGDTTDPAFGGTNMQPKVGGWIAAANPALPHSVTISGPVGSSCGTSDFNGDGDFGTDSDIEAFFACLAGNCCATCWHLGADFNADGDTGTDADIEAFFRVLAGNPC